MTDEERKAPEEVKKKTEKMTDEELEQVAGGGMLDTIKKIGESVKDGITGPLWPDTHFQHEEGQHPKTLQYLMGHSDIGVTMNTYTHLGLDAARDEMIRMEELEQARQALQGGDKVVPISQLAFKAVWKSNTGQAMILRSVDRGIFFINPVDFSRLMRIILCRHQLLETKTLSIL